MGYHLVLIEIAVIDFYKISDNPVFAGDNFFSILFTNILKVELDSQ